MLKPGSSVRWWSIALLLAIGCHREESYDLPLFERKISIADKFYDIHAFDEKRAIVVGYAGKVLATADGGNSWTVQPSNTQEAIYSVDFADDNHGWACGQDGLILHTADGGKTWSVQESGTNLYLFAVDFVDPQHGWVVGDRSTYLHTADGGKTWQIAKIASIGMEVGGSEEILAEEPILYDVQFLDAATGWIVGEFGNIYFTTDGGKNWKSQKDTLLGAEGVFNPLDLPTFFGVHFIDRSNGLAVGLDTKIARTSDGGANWHFEKFAEGVSQIDPLYRPFQFPDKTAFAVGAVGVTVHQTAPGEPWTRAELGMEINTWLRGVQFLDKNNGWIVGGYGLILHTTDGGKSWLPSFG